MNEKEVGELRRRFRPVQKRQLPLPGQPLHGVFQAQGLSPALRAPDTGQLPGRMGPGIPGAGGAAVPVLPHPAAQVRRRAGIQGVVPAPEHIDIVHSLTSLPPAYHDPPPGATVTPGDRREIR